MDEKSRFVFGRAQKPEAGSPDLTRGFLIPKPSAGNSYWPRSYERSMSFYSRSPPVSENAYLGHSSASVDVPRLGHSSASVDVPRIYKDCDQRLDDAEQPLLCSTHNGQPAADIDGGQHRSHPEFSAEGTVWENSGSHTGGNNWKMRQTTFFQSLLNGTNVLAGVGILSMPYALSEGGWMSMNFLLIFAAVCCYTGILLSRCMNLDPSIVGYPDVGQAAFGRFGRLLVSGLLYFELFAVSIEFLILEGDNLTRLFPWDGIQLKYLQLSSEQSFMIISALVMLPTVWLRDLSLISYISAGGVVACVALLVATLWIGITDTGFSYQGSLIAIDGMPIAVGLYAFCYCGHAVFPNIYGSMKDKTKFPHVLIICFLLCTLLYGGMAVVGFLMFGDSIKSQITLSLPEGQIATQLAIFAALINPFAKYALTVTPLAAALEELLPNQCKGRNLMIFGMITRTLLVSCTLLVALVVPFFAYLMAFVGSFLSTTVSITIPCLCYLKLYSQQVTIWEKGLIVLIIALGLLACTGGTYTSVVEIAKSFSNT